MIACVFMLGSHIFFANVYEMLNNIHKYSMFDSYIGSFKSLIICVFCVGTHICILSIMPITFAIVHTYISISNSNAYEVLSDSYIYFTFGHPYYPFTFITY